MNRVIVENFEAFNSARRIFSRSDKVVWHTTSPWLLDRLPARGVDVETLEKFHLMNERVRLYAAVKEAGDKAAAFIDQGTKTWSRQFLLGRALGDRLRRVAFIFFYKAYLLNKWRNFYASPHNHLFVVGNSCLSPVLSFDVNCGRFDTLFAVLKSFMEIDSLAMIPFDPSPEEEKISRLMRDDMGLWERCLYYLNMNGSAWAFTFWKALKKRKIIKKSTISLTKSPKAHIFLGKWFLSLQELFWPLLSNGFRISTFELFHPKLASHPVPDGMKSQCQKEIRRIYQETFEEFGFNFHEDFEAAASILVDRVGDALKYALPLIDFIEEKYITYLRPFEKTALLTSGLTQPYGRLIQQYLVKHNVPVFSFEHGVCGGLEGKRCDVRDVIDKHTDGYDYFVSYSEESLDVYTSASSSLGGVVAGAPHCERTIRFRAVQRFLARKLIKLPRNKRVIAYIAFSPRNNFPDGPRCYTDWEYYLQTKTMVFDIFSKIEDRCVVKLYPTYRYKDEDPFADGNNFPPNVHAVQFFEFSWIRAAFDIIIHSHPQSTFGWVAALDVPTIFIEWDSYPVSPAIRQLVQKGTFYFHSNEKGWKEGVLDLLKRPHEELIELWEDKKRERVALKERVLGPSKSAQQVVEEIFATINSHQNRKSYRREKDQVLSLQKK